MSMDERYAMGSVETWEFMPVVFRLLQLKRRGPLEYAPLRSCARRYLTVYSHSLNPFKEVAANDGRPFASMPLLELPCEPHVSVLH